MDQRGATQLTFGVAIGTNGVIDEPRGVPSAQGIDTDTAVEGICVLPPHIISEKPSKGHQGTDLIEVEFYCSSLSVEVYRCWENQFSCVFWGKVYNVGVAFEHLGGGTNYL